MGVEVMYVIGGFTVATFGMVEIPRVRKAALVREEIRSTRSTPVVLYYSQ